MRWRTAGGDKTRLRVEEYGRRYLLELVRAAVVQECVVAQLVEQGQISVSRIIVGSNYWSWRCSCGV